MSFVTTAATSLLGAVGLLGAAAAGAELTARFSARNRLRQWHREEVDPVAIRVTTLSRKSKNVGLSAADFWLGIPQDFMAVKANEIEGFIQCRNSRTEDQKAREERQRLKCVAALESFTSLVLELGQEVDQLRLVADGSAENVAESAAENAAVLLLGTYERFAADLATLAGEDRSYERRPYTVLTAMYDWPQRVENFRRDVQYGEDNYLQKAKDAFFAHGVSRVERRHHARHTQAASRRAEPT